MRPPDGPGPEFDATHSTRRPGRPHGFRV